jgi:hypothetical protein
MLRTAKDLEGYAIGATDGAIGHAADFLFDDEDWVIRYLVVDTGGWLSGRQVLISPFAIGHPDWSARVLPLSITKDRVRNSPDIDTRKPVSRQHEADYLGYYGYPVYWGGSGLWGMGAFPGGVTAEDAVLAEMKARGERTAGQAPEDAHLRSCTAVTDYRIHAADGEIGHVEDFLVDDRTWAIRYLVVNTSNWWVGHRMLVAPQWVDGVNWSDRTVSVDLTRQEVKNAPPYDSAAQFDRQQEAAIYEHYGRRDYWTPPSTREPAGTRR